MEPVKDSDTVAGRLAALDDQALKALALTAKERDWLMRRGCGELAVNRAARLARELGGSLAWLAGAEVPPGAPPEPSLVFSLPKLQEARQRAGVRDDGLRRKCKATPGEWRQLTTGRREPTLAQLQRLAETLSLPSVRLLA